MSAPVCPLCGNTLPPGETICPTDGYDTSAEVERTSPRVLPDDLRARQSAARDPLLGQKLGEYLVQRRVGRGGAGIVYEGIQPAINRRVAIKVLKAELSGEQGLLQEARVATSIRHRGIIEVYSFGELPTGGQYIVMEYLEGESLDALIKRSGPPPTADALQFIDEVLAALGAAHDRGIVHRDLKPTNIFLANQAGGRYVKVLDFGLAKRFKRGESYYSAPTEPNVLIGSPEYLSPEQAMGADATPRSDLYAVGCVLYELIAGRPPFTGTSPLTVALNHVTEAVPPLSDLVPSVNPHLAALVGKLLEKKPENRPETAAKVRDELKRIREGLAAATTQPVSESEVARAARTSGAQPRPSGPRPAARGTGPQPVAPAPVPAASAPAPAPRRLGMIMGVGLAIAALIGAVVFFLVRG